MKVLIANAFEPNAIEELRDAGFEVAYDPKLTADALRDAIAKSQAAVLIVRGTKVTADMLEASPHLSLVVRAGAGVNTIDVAAASKRSILVANCPGRNAVAVAELTFGLILALDRRIVDNVADLRAGKWNKKEYSAARGLKGRTLGIIGMGRIGQEVAHRAQAFEMPTVAWSRSFKPMDADAYGVDYAESAGEVAERCDILTIHLAAAAETKNLVNAGVIGKLKPGSYVINTARADVLDYAALAAAIRERGLRAGLDVYPGEPEGGAAEFHAEILKAGGVVYGTHHIGASTDQAQQAIADETVRIVKLFRDTGEVDNCVNIAPHPTTDYLIVVRHMNQPGVLAHVLNHLGAARINVEEMENAILTDKRTACARIRLEQKPGNDLLRKIESGSEHILGISLVELGAG